MFGTHLAIQMALFVVLCTSLVTHDKHQEADSFSHDVCQDSCNLSLEQCVKQIPRLVIVLLFLRGA